MEAELAMMIAAGRRQIEEEHKQRESDLVEQAKEDIRLRSAHLSKLPEWMREYASCEGRYTTSVEVLLPGCSPVCFSSSLSRDDDCMYHSFRTYEPMSVQFSDDGDQWFVDVRIECGSNLETVVAKASEWGESYWQMSTEIDRRNQQNIKPFSPAASAGESIEAQPMASFRPLLTRIADALELIAESAVSTREHLC